MRRFSASTVTGAVVLNLNESLGLEWRTPIVAQAGYVTETSMGESLVRTGNSIYLAGTSDVPKEDGPAGGGYWNAGLVASLDESGVVRWTRSVTLTAHSERFRALWVVGSRLFAVGSGAGGDHSGKVTGGDGVRGGTTEAFPGVLTCNPADYIGLVGTQHRHTRQPCDHAAEKACLNRNVTFEELGTTGMYLLSNLSGGMTGEVLHVDAGYSIVGL